MRKDKLAELGHGTYILILRLKKNQLVQVGNLGSFNFQTGFYAYVGSAFGPGGLTARLKHHLGSSARPHWHIDYLLQWAKLEQVWLTEEAVHREHQWAALLQDSPFATVSVKRFGASDCKCLTHLFYLQKRPDFRLFQEQVQNQFPNDAPVQAIKIY